MKTSRRTLLKTLLAGLITWMTPVTARARRLALPLARLQKLSRPGGWTIIKLKGRPLMLIRESNAVIRALDPTCTHQKCLVAYDPASQAITCPCHRSRFKITGQVVSGPAKTPLKSYKSEIKGGNIIVELS